MTMNLGERIRMAREAKGLNQDELAELMKVEPPTVSRWESGEIRPRPKRLVKLAEILDRTVDWLNGVAAHPESIAKLQSRIESLEATKDAALDKDTKELVRIFRDVIPTQRRAVIEFARTRIAPNKGKASSRRSRA